MEQVAEVDARFAGRDVPRPPHWGGYRLTPARIEFWKNGAFRLHDRFMYERSGDGWTVTRLEPVADAGDAQRACGFFRVRFSSRYRPLLPAQTRSTSPSASMSTAGICMPPPIWPP